MKRKRRASGPSLALMLCVLGLLAAALAAPGAAIAAGGDILWSVPISGAGTDEPVGIPVGPAGSALLCGTLTPAGVPNAFAIRETLAGAPDWIATWGGTLDHGANTRAAVYDAGGGSLYLVALVRDPVHYSALQVVKVDASGAVVWTRGFTARSNSTPLAEKAAVDAHGNLYVAGETIYQGDPTIEAFLLKFSPRGALLWERTWWAGKWEVNVFDLAVTPAGTAYCVGGRQESGGARRSFVRAISPSGRALWTKALGGTTGDPLAFAVTTGRHGVVAAGRRDQAGVVKGVVEEYTPSGRLLWRRSVSTGSDGDGFLDVAVARDGRVFASGASAFPATGDAGPYVVALQASGKVVWRSQWDHEGWGEKIVVSRSSVYVGATLAAADATDTELAGVECLNAVNGSTTWRRPYDLGSGTNDAGLRDLTVVPGQSVYIAVDVRDDATGKDAHFLRLAP